MTRATIAVVLLGTMRAVQAGVLHVPADLPDIAAAVHEAEEGDTILLAPGIYKESVRLPDNVALIGEKRDECIIVGKENRPVVKGGNGVLLKNLTIERGSAGIRCENAAMIIEGNVLTENREAGIHCLISLPMIRNNIIVRNDWTGIYCESAHALRTRIEHNIIAENTYSAITLAGRSEMVIQNNIICHNGEFGIWASKESRRTRIEHNVLFNNRRSSNQYAVVNASNLTLDPAFPTVRADVYDYLHPPRRSFKSLGKGGAPIGLISENELARTAHDKDRDGVKDALDQCPGVAEDRDGFEDEDGCPEFDNDEDGIYDRRDKCDNEAEDKDGFMDFDGCPDPDNDEDGVPDSVDQCPDEAETANGYKDDDGCPDRRPDDGGE